MATNSSILKSGRMDTGVYMTTTIPEYVTSSQTFNNFTNMSSVIGTPCYSGTLSSSEYLKTANDVVFTESYIPALVLTCLMFIVGLPGNLLVIAVYLRKGRKGKHTPCGVFILALAVFDLFNCLLMPFEIIFIRNIIQFDYNTGCRFTRMMTYAMNNASSFTLVAIAVDRYRRMYHAQNSNAKHAAKRVVMIVIILALLIAIPAAVLYGTRTLHIPITDGTCVTGKTCSFSDSYNETEGPFYLIIFTTIGHLTIDIIIIVCYVFIGFQALRRGGIIEDDIFETDINDSFATVQPNDDESMTATREQMVKNGNTPSESKSTNIDANEDQRKFIKEAKSKVVSRTKRAYQTTLMLLTVTLLFIISFFPFTLISMISRTDPSYYSNLSSRGKTIYQLFLRFYLLNSAMNPVIYSFYSDKFRLECKNVFKRLTCQ